MSVNQQDLSGNHTISPATGARRGTSVQPGSLVGESAHFTPPVLAIYRTQAQSPLIKLSSGICNARPELGMTLRSIRFCSSLIFLGDADAAVDDFRWDLIDALLHPWCKHGDKGANQQRNICGAAEWKNRSRERNEFCNKGPPGIASRQRLSSQARLWEQSVASSPC